MFSGAGPNHSSAVAPDHIRRQPLQPRDVLGRECDALVDRETGVPPGAHLVDHLLRDPALVEQELEDL